MAAPGIAPAGSPAPTDEDLALVADMQYYDDVALGMLAETAAMRPASKIPVQALPTRQYLDATVVPLLLLGLEAIAQEQPKDPVEYLAAFLISNNPQRDANLPHPPGNPLLRGLVPPPVTNSSVAAGTSVAPTPAPM
jgi:hypothetical protein